MSRMADQDILIDESIERCMRLVMATGCTPESAASQVIERVRRLIGGTLTYCADCAGVGSVPDFGEGDDGMTVCPTCGGDGHVTAPECATCRYCDRPIVYSKIDGWIDPEATGDDSVWRETCDEHDTFEADHQPVSNDNDTKEA